MSEPLVEGDNRPPVYYENGTLIIRASALGGSCLWELAAAGQGYPPATLPESLVRAFRAGHELEPVIIKMLAEDYEFQFVTHQEEGHLLIPLDDVVVKIRYHSDGIAWILYPAGTPSLGGHQRVVEAKALGNDLWQKAVRGSVGDCIDEYPWQLSVMMYATGLPGVWAAYNKGIPEKMVDGFPMQELCEDQGKLHLEWVDMPPISYEEIVAKVKAIKEAVEGEDVVSSGKQCDDPGHWPCRYLHLRPEQEDGRAEYVEVDPDDRDKLDELVQRYLGFKGTAEEAKKQQDATRDEIIALVGVEKGTHVTDKWVVPVMQSVSYPVDWSRVSKEAKEEFEAAKGKKIGSSYLKGIKRRD